MTESNKHKIGVNEYNYTFKTEIELESGFHLYHFEIK